MPLDPVAIARVDERCRDAGVVDAPLVVLHVSAGNPFRRWPAERFAELAAALATQPDPLSVVITSGPSEADAASRVAALARTLARDEGERIVRVFQGRAQISGRSLEEVQAEAMANQSIKSMIDPWDIAQLAVFLASDAAKAISGQVIPIDNDRQRA